MDLIGRRFEARHLEVDGRLREALDVCHDILRHYADAPPTEQLLPVFVQASEISLKLGDREGGAALLLLAAERYAEAGLARPVIDLYQRLRRIGPGRRGLDLQFARRMLEHRHPTAAREFLTALAQRQKKEKLLTTLERMATWHDDEVQHTLLDFLDKAQGLRVSGAHARPTSGSAGSAERWSQPVVPPLSAPEATTEGPPAAREPESPAPATAAPSAAVTEVRAAVRTPPPSTTPTAASDEVTEVRPAVRQPPPAPRTTPDETRAAPFSPLSPAAPTDRVTAPRRGVRAEPESSPPTPRAAASPEQGVSRPSAARAGQVMAADAVVFVTPAAAEPAPPAGRVSPARHRTPVARPRRQRRGSVARVAMGAVAVVTLAAGGVVLAPRMRRTAETPGVVVPPAANLAVASADVTPAADDALVMQAAAESVAAAAAVGEDTAPPATRASTPMAAETPSPIRPSAVRRDEPPAGRSPPLATTATVPLSGPVTSPVRQSPDTTRPPTTAAPREPPAPAATVPPPTGPRVDYPVVVVDGLEILAIAREEVPGAQRIVIRQLLPSGDTLDLTESDLGEQSVSVGAGRLLVRRHPSGGSMGTVRVGRFLVNARAPVEPEVLEQLLRRLVVRR